MHTEQIDNIPYTIVQPTNFPNRVLTIRIYTIHYTIIIVKKYYERFCSHLKMHYK